MSVCVRPSVHAGVVPKRLNVGSRKQRCVHDSNGISDAKDLREIQTEPRLTGSPNADA